MAVVPAPASTMEPRLFSSVDVLILPPSTTGAEVRAGTSLIHLLIRGAMWSAPVGSYIALSPLQLSDGGTPIATPVQDWPRQYWHYLNPAYNVTSPSGPPMNGLPFAWWDLTPQNPDGSFTQGARWNSSVSGNISTWAEPVNQEDEILDAIVQTGLLSGDLKCYIKIVSVAEGLLLCNGTIYPTNDEQMFFVIPPFLLSSLDVNSSLYRDNEPQNTPYTVVVFITPETSVIRTIRQYITGILGLVTLVSTIVGKEPHIHIMSIARMSLIGRVLECGDEVDLLLSPTQIPLGRGIEKARYFGALIFNTAIAMGLLIGHNVIARIFPRLLPDPPPSLQFVIAGALLPGITLAGIKTMTLQSSPVQFFLAIVVLLMFIGAWFGCYWVTARDKNFFHRYGRWQHKTDPFFMLRWRVFFTSYKAKRRIYVLAEIIITLLMAVPSGVTLSAYLTKDQSCRFRAIAMISIVGVDTLLVLLLRPYAIKIDTVVYAIAKFFELAISAAAVARSSGSLKYALEIGTVVWIAGALFIGVWQSYRAYDKAQYNSQQNEFFLTTADTDDVVFNELGGDGKLSRRHGTINEDDDDDDDEHGVANKGLGPKKKSTLQSLFPDSDYAAHPNDDQDDDDDDVYSPGDNDLLFRNGASPRDKSKPQPKNVLNNNNNNNSRERSGTQPPTTTTMGGGDNNPSPWKGRLPPRNTTSSTSADDAKNNKNNNSAAAAAAQQKAQQEEKDELEMALLTSQAPRLQFANRGDSEQQSLSIPPSVGTISLPDDPLVEFWDALSDSTAYNKKNQQQQQRRQSSNDGFGGNDDDDEEMLSYSKNNNKNNNNTIIKTSTTTAEVHGTQANVNFAPKLAVREVANKRKISEAQPCRFQESLEAPAELRLSDDDDDDDFLNPNSHHHRIPRKQRAATMTLISGSGPNAVRKTNSLKKLEAGEYASKFAELFGEDVMSTPTSQTAHQGRTASLPPKFVDDEFQQRFGKTGKVAADGVGIEL